MRETSCSRGWLRLVVQALFGIITVVSFILIVRMAIQVPGRRPRADNRCMLTNCRVVCYDAPYYEEFEGHIIHTLRQAVPYCENIDLTLKQPMFINSTMPLNWLSNARCSIAELTIMGGNLKHIPPYAFISTFASSIKVLTLDKITITTWAADTFLGLNGLRELHIINSELISIHTFALKAISTSLHTLNVKSENMWNPVNVTGSADLEKLTTVDFSKNTFYDILGPNSFSKLENCKILYLNYCKITAIKPGAFNNLKSIEILLLNNNQLMHIPDGLFNVILSLEHRPRINLHDNPWYCSCSNNDLRNLHNEDLFIVEPTCYYPEDMRGTTFSEFEKTCSDNSKTEFSISHTIENSSSFFQMNDRTYSVNNKVICHDKFESFESRKIISPIKNYSCLGNRLQSYEISIKKDIFSTACDWIEPVFYSQSQSYSIVELNSSITSRYGLLWYQSMCPREVYCISISPRVLRVYNVNRDAYYTFCRVEFKNDIVAISDCVKYELSSYNSYKRENGTILYILTGFLCLSCGALCVYVLIRGNPMLLKGSKRILFVKHKHVDALILPPKIPVRNNKLTDSHLSICNGQNIFMISAHVNSSQSKFARMNSTRSNNSIPSYISAIQPTEDQLADWRLRHHAYSGTFSSLDSNASKISMIHEGDSVPYSQFGTKDPMCDIIK